MSLENWNRIKEFFLEAIEVAPEMRARFLDEKCPDESLRREVEKLIRQDEEASSLMNRPAIENSAVHFLADSINDSDPLIGKVIGAYRLTEELGRGGMGAVYLAERVDESFRQRVAVKLIKRGMETDSILRRFRNERQILAALSHPLISRLYGGGMTADGLPYFVMEYVEGEPLYRFFDDRKLNLKERLKIFVRICEAVHAAHEIKVVHRDLKPSNILVKADGTPKLLDFGIAKLLDPELSDGGVEQTATMMRMMTPEYASPEQVSGGETTPASDIYSLGVLLYESLSGHRPYRFKNRAPLEIARVICEQLPESLSRSLDSKETFLEKGEEAATLMKVLESRGSNLSELRRALSGDLEKIVMNALAKKPEDRYQTARELAEDIELYLAAKPVKKQAIIKNKPSVSAAENKVSVAVLPLQIIGAEASGESGDKYLSVGLADAMITRLSNVRRLVVRPTTSILRFGDAEDAFAAGRALGVDFVLSGMIRRAGVRIRISAQLLEVKTDSTVWAENFNENFTDVLDLEDAVSEKVAGLLIPKLTGEEKKQLNKRGTNSPAAYEAFMRARYLANQFTNDAILRSIAACKEAIRLDPNYALPRVGIAEFYVWSSVFGEFEPHEAYPKAKEELNRALEIDDQLAEAYALRSFVALLYDWDWAEAERLVKKSLKINPNYYFAHNALAHVFASQGAAEQAMKEIRISEALDPLSPLAKVMTSCISYQAGHFEEATQKARQGSEMQINFPQGFLHLGNALPFCGANEEAIEVLTKLSELWQDSALPKSMLCFALDAAGETQKAKEVLQSILKMAETQPVKPYFIAMAYVAVGEIEEAFRWFSKAIEARDEWMIWFGTDIKLDSLRNDARYFEILKQTNNPIISRQKRRAEI